MNMLTKMTRLFVLTIVIFTAFYLILFVSVQSALRRQELQTVQTLCQQQIEKHVVEEYKQLRLKGGETK